MRYAAYGSNLHPLRLQERVPSARFVATALVDGWSLVFHKRSNHDASGKCNIVAADAHVWFAIYDIDDAEKPALDQIEGLHNGYVDTPIEIHGHADCYTYMATVSHIEDHLLPYSWYKELVIAGIEHHALPAKYLDRVRAIEHAIDPDPDRHALHMNLVARARAVNRAPNKAARGRV